MSDIPEYPHFDEIPGDDPGVAVIIWTTSSKSPNNHFIAAHCEEAGKRLVLYENKPCGGKATVVCSNLIEATTEELKAAFAPIGDDLVELDRSEDGVQPFEAKRCTAVVTPKAVTIVELTIKHQKMPGLPTDMTQDRMRACPLSKAHLEVAV